MCFCKMASLCFSACISIRNFVQVNLSFDAQNGKRRATTLCMHSVKFISLAACNLNVVCFVSLQNTFCNFRHLGFT